jgi:hypothetical protein
MFAVALAALWVTAAAVDAKNDAKTDDALSADKASAAAAEERAFVAVEEKRWCDAVFAFLEADTLAPSAALLLNAAQAAEVAGDLERTRALFVRVQQNTQGKAAKDLPKELPKDLKKRLKKLDERIQKEGPGTACVAAPPPPPVVVEAPPPDPEPAPVVVAPAADDGAWIAPAAWTTAGVGGVVVASGVVLAVVGALPYADHAAAREAILSAEQAGADASALQAQQATARESWEGYGQASVVSGVVAVGVGLVALGGGIAAALLLSPAPPEEP